MRTVAQIESLLPELEFCTADELEDQYLDFKQWMHRAVTKPFGLWFTWRCAWPMAGWYGRVRYC